MIDSTVRGLTEPCPRPGCNAAKHELCFDGQPYIHAARRNLFFIESGKKKTKRELRLSYVPTEE